MAPKEDKRTKTTPTISPKPSRYGTPLECAMNIIILIMITTPIFVLCYSIVRGPGLERYVLPPATGAIVREVALEIREKLGMQCKLGAICTPGEKRPLLESGEPSHAIWDRARYLMKSKFQYVHETNPKAKVNYMWQAPLVVYFDDILTENEISTIINAAGPKFRKSMVVDKHGTPQEDKTRTSDTAWLYPHEDDVYKEILKKVTALAGFPAENAEPMGVNRYQQSQYFNPHYDYLREEQLNPPSGTRPACQRTSTVLIYLSDVEKGGETMFARDGRMDGSFAYDSNNENQLKVTPKKGRVLIWYNMHPYTEKIDPQTLHGGSPVLEGTKIAATVFIRNCSQVTSPPALTEGTEKQEL